MTRSTLFALLTVQAFILAACSSTPQSSGQMQSWLQDSHTDRFIVLTVRSQLAPRPPRAGSTARAYAEPSRYTASPATLLTAQAIATDHKLKEVTGWPISILGVHCLVYELEAGVNPNAALEQLRKDARVESAQPLNAFQTLRNERNDRYNALQTNLAAMNVHQAHRWSHGHGVRVAIVDTHIDRQHPDLAGRVASYRDFVPPPAPPPAAERHGTAIAGVIAANANNDEGIVGVAPDARIIALRACWYASELRREICNTLTLAKALVAAIESRADIVNLSLGGPADPLLARLVGIGLRRGILFVGAIPGGEGESFPTSIPGVIAVGLMDGVRTADATVFAPGKEILTLAPHGSYDFMSGSSIAAANVSGAIALLLETKRELSANEARDLLSVRGDSEPRIDLCAALTRLRGAGTCDEESGDEAMK